MYRRRKMSKFFNEKVETEDGVFDSKLEYHRWVWLKTLEKKNEITNLQRQIKYVLIPAQYILVERVTKSGREGKPKLKLIEKECAYYADFQYNFNGKVIIEDTKSKATKTKEYVIKRKLMRMQGHPITEITKSTQNIC